MAESKPIKNTELIQKDVFQNTIDQAIELETALTGLVTSFKAINKETTKQLKGVNIVDSKTLKEANTLLVEATKNRKLAKTAEEQLLKVQKEKIKIQEQEQKQQAKLKVITDEEIKQNEVLKRQEKDRVAMLRAIAVENSKTLGLEERLLATNARLRLERKALLGTEENYLQRLKQINDELDNNNAIIKQNSDKQKQQALNVGNYSESIQDALSKSSLFGGIIQKITGFVETYESIILAKTAATKTDTVTTEANAVAHVTNTTAIEAETVATEQLSLAKRTLNAITSPVGLILLAGAALIALAKAVYDVNQSLQDTATITKAVFQDTVWQTGEKQFENLARATIKYRKEAGQLQLQLQELEDTQADLTEIANDETLALGIREKAFKDAQQARIEASTKNLEIATREKELADQAVLAEESRLGVGKGRALQEFYDKQIEAQKKLFDASDRLGDLERTNAEETRKFTEQKIIGEIELLRSKKLGADSAVDALKKQVDDEQTLLKTRRNAFILLEKEQQKAQNEEINLLTKFGLKKAEIQDLINTKDALALQRKLVALSVDRLSIGQQDELAKVVNEIQKNEIDRGIQKNKLDEKEIENKATLLRLANEIEQITLDKEAVDARQYLADIASITQKEQESSLRSTNVFNVKKIKSTKEAFEKQKKAQDEATKADLEAIEKKYSDEIELIKKQIKDKTKEEEIGFAEIKKLQLQKTNAIEDVADKEVLLEASKQKYLKELRKKQTQETLSELSKVSQALSDELDRRNQIEDEARQRGIDKQNEAVDAQRRLAEKGATNTLAFEEAQLAKKEQANRDALEKEARIKEQIALAEAYLNAYNSRLQQADSDPNQAPIQALSDVLLAKGIAKGLVQFAAEGNNMIEGAGTTTSDSIPFMLSKSEAVIKAESNLKHNDAVVALNAGDFDKKFIPRASIPYQQESNYMPLSHNNMVASLLIQQNEEIKSILKEINEKPVPFANIDNLGNLITGTMQKGFINRTKSKIRI